MNRFVLEAEKLICDYSDSDGDVRGVVVEKLKIPKVGVTVIFGGSGSGKSTLLSIITGSRRLTQISDQTSLGRIQNHQSKVHNRQLQCGRLSRVLLMDAMMHVFR